MKELYPLKGIVTVLNTPFTQDGQLDIESLRKNTRLALKAGVHGFLVPAMASEVYKLSIPERLKMVETVLEEAGDKVPVFAGAGETELAKSKIIISEYLEIGCRQVLLQIPYKEEMQFRDHFMELADLGADTIMLQDWDSNGYGLPDELICDLFENIPAFRCLKVETVPAGVKYSRILRLTNGRLNVSGGWAVMQMIEGMKRGVHAFMPTGMHFIYTEIYNHYASGNLQEAEKLFKELLPVLAFSNQHLDISIHFFKRLLYSQGIYQTSYVRSPALEFDAVHESVSAKHISRVMQMEEEIKKVRHKEFEIQQ
jgi:4-hydroxy-tetrahydrodipicolinate synthase